MEYTRESFFSRRIPRDSEERQKMLDEYNERLKSALKKGSKEEVKRRSDALQRSTIRKIPVYGPDGFMYNIISLRKKNQHKNLLDTLNFEKEKYNERFHWIHEITEVKFYNSAIKNRFTDDEMKEILWSRWKDYKSGYNPEYFYTFRKEMSEYLEDEIKKIESGERLPSAT